MDRLLLNPRGRIIALTLAGITGGAAFGCVFGWLASWFQNGPDMGQGMMESAGWFACVGTVGGFLLGLEGAEPETRSDRPVPPAD